MRLFLAVSLLTTFAFIVSARPASFTLDLSPAHNTPSNMTLNTATAGLTSPSDSNTMTSIEEWPWWITPVGWGLVCYDAVALLMLCWLWIHGVIDGIWSYGNSARNERRVERWQRIAWERQDVEEVRRSRTPEEVQMLARQDSVNAEMRRLGMI